VINLIWNGLAGSYRRSQPSALRVRVRDLGRFGRARPPGANLGVGELLGTWMTSPAVMLHVVAAIVTSARIHVRRPLNRGRRGQVSLAGSAVGAPASRTIWPTVPWRDGKYRTHPPGRSSMLSLLSLVKVATSHRGQRMHATPGRRAARSPDG
jgi:hypothetical protein